MPSNDMNIESESDCSNPFLEIAVGIWPTSGLSESSSALQFGLGTFHLTLFEHIDIH